MIEDDEELASIITKFLKKYDIAVTNIETPLEGIENLKEGNYSLLILDLTLPELDGLEVVLKIREFSSIPIIISSARDDIVDKVLGLERGADDYLPKPYNPRELVARIKSLLRREQKSSKEDTKNLFVVDEDALSISFKGEPLSLTPAEYDILKRLIKYKNRVVSRLDFIYESEFISDDASEKNIDVMVSRIRSKLAKIDPEGSYIKSSRGIGYTLTL
ncbi:MAG: DNA-binding response regulator [Sulfurospirillum sp.]|nr:MAG: DNA-binding response regulator [Sulfurospirillum sp.]